MIAYEILNLNRELFCKMSVLGIKFEDYKYVDLYSDYINLRNDGQKITYIIAFLASKYKIGERKTYSLIERLGRDCKLYAVE